MLKQDPLTRLPPFLSPHPLLIRTHYFFLETPIQHTGSELIAEGVNIKVMMMVVIMIILMILRILVIIKDETDNGTYPFIRF